MLSEPPFWATSYGASYGGSGSLMLDEHLARAERLARGEDVAILTSRPRLQPLPRRFHPRSSRVRAFHLFLASLQPLDPTKGTPIDEPLARGFADVPAVVRGRKNDDAWMLGARVLLGPGKGSPRARLLSAKTRPNYQEILRSHAITEDAFVLLEQVADPQFIEARHDHVKALERAHAEQYVDAEDADADEFDEPEIDLDDEGDSAA